MENGHLTPSIVKQPDDISAGGSYVLWMASVADEIPAWGTNLRDRDAKLREFYKSEDMLAGAIFGTASRYATFKWSLEGPERQCKIVHRMLHQCEHGRGWLQLMIPVVKDYLTQDNGAYIELVRLQDDPLSPVIQMNHLDAARCIPTGRWDIPVVYTDIHGKQHELKYYQVVRLTEYPSPDERMRGYQECAVTRMLNSARKRSDIITFEREKFGGRNPSSIHFIGGIHRNSIEDVLKIVENQANQKGYTKYLSPPIVASIDQTAHVTHEQVDLKGVPEGYDKEQDWREYIVVLALGLGIDPQDIAPLPGGNLGSAQQSSVLMQKGRGKGPTMFMTNMMHIMNMHGIMPQTVKFEYEEQDIAEDEQETMLMWRRAQFYNMLGTASGGEGSQPIIPPEIIRQIMRDNGDLKQEYLDAMGEVDLTPMTEISSDDKTKADRTRDGSRKQNWLTKLLSSGRND